MGWVKPATEADEGAQAPAHADITEERPREAQEADSEASADDEAAVAPGAGSVLEDWRQRKRLYEQMLVDCEVMDRDAKARRSSIKQELSRIKADMREPCKLDVIDIQKEVLDAMPFRTCFQIVDNPGSSLSCSPANRPLPCTFKAAAKLAVEIIVESQQSERRTRRVGCLGSGKGGSVA